MPQISCPHCRAAIVSKMKHAGKSARCPRCGGRVLLPDPRLPDRRTATAPQPPPPRPAPAPIAAPTRSPAAELLPARSTAPTAILVHAGTIQHDSQTGRRIAAVLISALLLPGGGHLFLGRVGAGLVLLFAWLICGAIGLVGWSLIAAAITTPGLGLPAAMLATIGAGGAALVWLVSLVLVLIAEPRRPSRPQEILIRPPV